MREAIKFMRTWTASLRGVNLLHPNVSQSRMPPHPARTGCREPRSPSRARARLLLRFALFAHAPSARRPTERVPGDRQTDEENRRYGICKPLHLLLLFLSESDHASGPGEPITPKGRRPCTASWSRSGRQRAVAAGRQAHTGSSPARRRKPPGCPPRGAASSIPRLAPPWTNAESATKTSSPRHASEDPASFRRGPVQPGDDLRDLRDPAFHF